MPAMGKNIPVDIDKSHFIEAYWDFASQYVPGVRKKLAQMADEVWDSQVLTQMIVHRYNINKKYQDATYCEFKQYANGDDNIIVFSTYYNDELHAYNTVLYDLLVHDMDYDKDCDG